LIWNDASESAANTKFREFALTYLEANPPAAA
jgi:hypothetical protein